MLEQINNRQRCAVRVLVNPPFNDSDWNRSDDDVRWKYGLPPMGNANFAWVRRFIRQFTPNSCAGFVQANGSMSCNQSTEVDFRKAIIDADLVDFVITASGQFINSTQIPTSYQQPE